MKKLFLLLIAFASFLVAAEQYGLMQSLLDRQTALAVAINSYIEDRGSVPPSIAVLKNANYLPLAYDEKNPFDKDALSFSISNYQIRIDSNVESATRKTDQVLYYINSVNNRDLDRQSVQEGGKLISYYALSAKAATNLNLSSYLSYATFKGDIEPSAYQSVASGAFWFSSTYEDMYQVKLFNGSSWGKLEKSNKNFDSLSGDFVNLPTLPILKSSWQTSQVNVTQQTKPILCLNGGTYNVYKFRCEAYTSSSCSTAGTSFNPSTKLCDKGANSACTWFDPNGVYNGSTCERIKEVVNYLHVSTPDGNPQNISCGDVARIVAVSDHTYVTANAYDWGFSSTTVNGLNQNLIYVDNAPYTVTYSYFLQNNHHYHAYFFTNIKNNATGQIYNLGSTEYAHHALTYSGSSTNMSVTISPTPYKFFGCMTSDTISLASRSDKEYYSPKCDNGLSPVGGRCAETPTCTAKTMPVAPYYATPYNGNNGVCYSDAALTCAQTGISWDGIYTCFNNSQTCNDTTYNLRTDLGYCEKFGYSCNTGKRYGLPESPTNNNSADLYNRISNKDDKLTAIVSTITKNDYNTNDNNGAMCAAVQFTTLSQPIYSPDYTIGGEVKSGF